MSRAARLALLALAGCAGPEPPPALGTAEIVTPEPPPPEPARVVLEGETADEGSRRVIPASHVDERASPSPIRVRRLVFRFEIRVPWGLGAGQSEIPTPTGELTVDLAGPRLRARFSGQGFPVDEGAEIRMRVDEPGTYVVDGKGGRPLTTGQLASWFQGGIGPRVTEMRVRTRAEEERETVDFVCRLFGEWAGSSMYNVRRTCASDGLPTRFYFGSYHVERTAEVWLTMPERALRADHLDVPTLRHEPSVVFHDRIMRERVHPSSDDPPNRRPEPEAPEVTDGVLVESQLVTRALVTVSGVPIGWLDPGARAHFDGIATGGYVISALMPLGGSAAIARAYELPRFVVLRPRP